jgi:hypothetical protein
MNTEALFLFLILLLGLVLCSFLGSNCGTEGFTGDKINEFNNKKINGSATSSANGAANGSANGAATSSANGAATGAPIVGDNYNHVSGSMTSLQNGSTLYGPNDSKIVVVQNSDGTQNLDITLPNGKIMTLYPKKQEKTDTFESTSNAAVESYTNYYGANGSATTFYGPNGVTASVIKGDNQQIAIHVETNQGDYTFTPNATYYNPENNNPENISSSQYYGSTGYQVNTYQGAYGGQAATATDPYGNTAYYAQGPYGNAIAGTTSTNPYYGTNQYNGPYGGQVNTATGPYGNTAYYAQGPYGNEVAGTTATGTTAAGTTATNTYYDTNQYYGANGGQVATATGPAGNTAYYAEGPNGNAIAGTTNGTNYSSSLPSGIPGSKIPPGQEDLYILKSQVVPPVCPVCPSIQNLEEIQSAKCPPCKPCGRCPEPSFECKKVPNYNAIGNNELPIPVLNDFSTFGM